MIKKEYLKPAMEVVETDFNDYILAGSVQTTGLNDDNLKSGGSGNIGDAMSRGSNIWDDEEKD